MPSFFDIFYTFVFVCYETIECIVKCFIPLRYQSKNISGQIVLLTGAGGGIGRPLALRLAQLGCKVVCWDVAKQANEETVRLIKQTKAEAFAYQIDVTDKEQVYQVAERVKKEVGKVDILINNAGVVTGQKLLDCPDEHIIRSFNVNILSHFWTVKSFLPDMIARKTGHIVTVASAGGLAGGNRLVDYCSSKFAAVGFDESLRVELEMSGHHGIKTTAICPYYVKTPLFPGVKSDLIPLLEPEYAADQIIEAILTNKQFSLFPSYLNILTVLKAIMPNKPFYRFTKLLGAHDAMNHFKGQIGKNQ